MFKSSLFIILVILPIALSSDRLAKLENTAAGRTVLATLKTQTKLMGVNANSIKSVLETTQTQNQNGYEAYEKQALAEKESCEADAKSLRASFQEAVSNRYSVEKNNESAALLRSRKAEYAASLNAEVEGYNSFINDIKKGQEAWTALYNSMNNSINTAKTNLDEIRKMVESANPHNSPSFAQIKSTESMANEIRANLEYRFYDTLGMKPILSGLLEVAAKGITTDQFYKISHTMDLIDNFLADRRNNLIEDNEYETTLNDSLTNSLNASVTSTNSEIEIVNGLISSLDTRMALLSTAVENAKTLSNYAKQVMEARAAICDDFDRTYFNHVRRYNEVRLTIAELSNNFDEEYKDFEAFLQMKSMQ
jgi:hypothetical protein